MEEVTINPRTYTEPPELTQDWQNRLLEGTNKTLGTPGPRRKEQLTHKRLTRVPVNVQESLVEALVGGGLLQSWGH